MLYTPQEISDIITLANTTLWKLAIKSEKNRFMRGEDVLEPEIGIIYDLKRAVEWGRTILYDAEDFHQLTAYLKWKCSGYGFDNIRPYYATPSTTLSTAAGSSTSQWVLFKQLVVGVTDPANLPDQAQTYTDADLVNRNVFVILDALPLAIGLADRQSYTFNSLTGQITWVDKLNQGQVVQIYTYVTGSGAWNPIIEFTVGDPGAPAAGITEYTDASLVGVFAVVDVDGSLLPRDLASVFSFGHNPLTGKITWTSALAAGQHVKIYSI